LYLYTGNNLNAKFHPNNDNFFTGKVGIGMEPIERFTLSGQQGFRQNGLVLLDNSYNNTLRIITNRAGDDDQHLFTFTYDGRFVVGDVFHDYNYPCTGPFGAIAGHKINSIDTSGSGANLSLTNVAGPRSNINDAGANLRFFRVNGDLTDVTPVSADQVIGSMRAYGYTGNTCFGEDRNAAINFVASDVFSNTNQGAYTTFETTCATDITNGIFERVRIDHNGNVGINTPSTNTSSLLYRQTTRPDWKFTVKDFDRETRPAAVIFAGLSASPMVQVIGGEGQLEQTALMLSDRNINDANTNHITFTHGSNDAQIARVSSLNRGAEGVNGGSLLFSTTNVTIGSGATAFIPPFERARINFDGDMGIGIKTPSSRLHIHDDDKSVLYASGILRDVVTVSTNNNTNGILLSSADLQSRVYNNNTDFDLHISTCTTGGSIKFDTNNEAFAAIITDTGVLGINVDESIKAGLVRIGAPDVKLAVNGDVLLFNSLTGNALGAGSRLFFNQSISSANTDPMFIHRVNTDLLTNVTELRVNIGDDICKLAPAGAPINYKNTDVLSVGNYSGSTGAPEGGLRPGPSVGDVWNKWIDVGHCSTVLYNN